MALTTPTIYDLKHDADAARFGLTPSERDYLVGQSNARSQWGATPKVIVLHIQDGTTVGSLDWWVHGSVNGVRVQASATVLIQRDGSILRVLGEDRAPWTNGDVQQPTAQSAYLRGLPGYIGAHCLTIEEEGAPGQPLTAAQLASTVWQIRDWSARYGISLNRNTLLPHSSINSVTRANCPSAVVYDAVYEASTTPSAVQPEPIAFYAKPVKPPVMQVGAITALTRIVTAGPDGVNRRVAPATNATLTGAPIAPGTTFRAIGVVSGESVDGESRWWLGDSGSYVSCAGTKEKP